MGEFLFVIGYDYAVPPFARPSEAWHQSALRRIWDAQPTRMAPFGSDLLRTVDTERAPTRLEYRNLVDLTGAGVIRSMSVARRLSEPGVVQQGRAFTFGEPAPDSVRLVNLQGMVTARGKRRAVQAHGLRSRFPTRTRWSAFALGMEERGTGHAATGSMQLPVPDVGVRSGESPSVCHVALRVLVDPDAAVAPTLDRLLPVRQEHDRGQISWSAPHVWRNGGHPATALVRPTWSYLGGCRDIPNGLGLSATERLHSVKFTPHGVNTAPRRSNKAVHGITRRPWSAPTGSVELVRERLR